MLQIPLQYFLKYLQYSLGKCNCVAILKKYYVLSMVCIAVHDPLYFVEVYGHVCMCYICRCQINVSVPDDPELEKAKQELDIRCEDTVVIKQDTPDDKEEVKLTNYTILYLKRN